MNRLILAIVLLILTGMILLGCSASSPDEPIIKAAKDGLVEFSKSMNLPFKDDSYTVMKNDDAFAEVLIKVKMKTDPNSDWQEGELTVQLVNAGGEWQLTESIEELVLKQAEEIKKSIMETLVAP